MLLERRRRRYIKPTHRPGSLEEFIRLLPEGIGVIPLTAGIRSGTEKEFHGVLKDYEQKAAQLSKVSQRTRAVAPVRVKDIFCLPSIEGSDAHEKQTKLLVKGRRMKLQIRIAA
jgi:hypothetical protein